MNNGKEYEGWGCGRQVPERNELEGGEFQYASHLFWRGDGSN